MKTEWSKPAGSAVYWPIMMDHFEGQKEQLRRGIAFAIRSPRAGSQAFLNEVRETVWSVDPNIPLANSHTLGDFYKESMARTSFTLVMLAIAGRNGAAAGGRGNLWRDCLFGVAADAGDRHSHGAGRAAGRLWWECLCGKDCG